MNLVWIDLLFHVWHRVQANPARYFCPIIILGRIFLLSSIAGNRCYLFVITTKNIYQLTFLEKQLAYIKQRKTGMFFYANPICACFRVSTHFEDMQIW